MPSTGVCSDSLEAPYQQMQSNSDSGDSNSTDDDDASLDPRIKVELDILNQASMDINRLENELDEARSKYRSTFAESSQRMEELGAKIRKNIQRARQYFELTERAKEAQGEAVRAARQYQTASSVYRAAKETIALAELRLMDEESRSASLSSAWQEMLNHATVRVMEAEREKSRSEAEHHRRAAVFAELEAQLHRLETKYKRSIAKSRPYFETKAELELKLQQLKQNVSDLQQAIAIRKSRYGEALRRLEIISEEIHECRRNKLLLLFPREPGVGAESDSVGSSVSDMNIEKGLFPPCSPTSDSCFNDEEDEKSDVTDGDDPRSVRRSSCVDEIATTDHAGGHRRQASCDSNDSSDSSTSEEASSFPNGQSDCGTCFLSSNSRGQNGPLHTGEPAEDLKGENCAAMDGKGEQSGGDQGRETQKSSELCLKSCSLSDPGLCENTNLRLAGDGSSSSELCVEAAGSADTVLDVLSTSTLVTAVSSHCATSAPQLAPQPSGGVSAGSSQQTSHHLTPAGEQTLISGSTSAGHDDLTCNNSTLAAIAAAGSTCVTSEKDSKDQSRERSKRSLRKGVMLLNPSRLATSSFWKLH